MTRLATTVCRAFSKSRGATTLLRQTTVYSAGRRGVLTFAVTYDTKGWVPVLHCTAVHMLHCCTHAAHMLHCTPATVQLDRHTVNTSNLYISLTHSRTHAHLHTLTYTHAPTHTRLHTRTYTHSPTHTHLHTPAYTLTHLHILTYTHAPTHTHLHSRTYTYSPTDTYLLLSYYSYIYYNTGVDTH